ncbi:MAG: hypothetical protein JWM14_146 [Chitinophagaceae bacterium]|nr:hypothetical protein [Chitinophagaceae bacterium]
MKTYLFNRKSLLATALLTATGFVFLALRIGMTGKSFYTFLLWNLFLGIIPLIPAYHFRKKMQKDFNWTLPIFFFAWLFLFPNAPYILTDFVHLHSQEQVPIWYDASLLFFFTLAGMFAGIVSLHWIHKGLDQLGHKWLSWLIVLFTIVLSGYGVFLGRVLRLNSWDVIVRTEKVITLSLQHLNNPVAISMTITFSIVLASVYGVFKIIRSSSYPAHETFLS